MNNGTSFLDEPHKIWEVMRDGVIQDHDGMILWEGPQNLDLSKGATQQFHSVPVGNQCHQNCYTHETPASKVHELEAVDAPVGDVRIQDARRCHDGEGAEPLTSEVKGLAQRNPPPFVAPPVTPAVTALALHQERKPPNIKTRGREKGDCAVKKHIRINKSDTGMEYGSINLQHVSHPGKSAGACCRSACRG